MTAPIRLQLAGLLASRPPTRAEGIRLLRYGFDADFGTEPMVQFALGQAYEAAGDRPAAAEAYGRFLRLWNKADSSAQPRVQEAREGLKRVTGEPTKP